MHQFSRSMFLLLFTVSTFTYCTLYEIKQTYLTNSRANCELCCSLENFLIELLFSFNVGCDISLWPRDGVLSLQRIPVVSKILASMF